jgi:hypothetical protein
MQGNVRKAIKGRHPDAVGIPPPFFYTNLNTDIEPSNNWDHSLGNMGLIPIEYEKYIKTLFNEDDIHRLKYGSGPLSIVGGNVFKERRGPGFDTA